MKKNQIILGISGILAILLTSVTGCGSGKGDSGGTNQNSSVTRELLSGTGTASGTGVTAKTWKLIAIHGNANYNGTGGDQTCPVVLDDSNDHSQTLECGASDSVIIRSDGTFSYTGVGKTWVLDGSTFTLNYGTAFGLQTATITAETVGGKQRLRIHQLTFTRNGKLENHDDGSEVILEEVTTY